MLLALSPRRRPCWGGGVAVDSRAAILASESLERALERGCGKVSLQLEGESVSKEGAFAVGRDGKSDSVTEDAGGGGGGIASALEGVGAAVFVESVEGVNGSAGGDVGLSGDSCEEVPALSLLSLGKISMISPLLFRAVMFS